MACILTLTLTQSAQRAALIAGLPAAKVQEYGISRDQIPRLLALPWTKITEEGDAVCVVPSVICWGDRDERDPLDAPIPYEGNEGLARWEEGAATTRPGSAEEAIEHAESVVARFTQALQAARTAKAASLAVAEEEGARRRAKEAARVAQEEDAWTSFLEGLAPEHRALVEHISHRPGRIGLAQDCIKIELDEEKRRADIGTHLTDLGMTELATRWAEGTCPEQEVTEFLSTHLLQTVLIHLPGEDFRPLTAEECPCACTFMEVLVLHHPCPHPPPTFAVKGPATTYPTYVWTVVHGVKARAETMGLDIKVEAYLHLARRACGGRAERWEVRASSPIPFFSGPQAVRSLGAPD